MEKDIALAKVHFIAGKGGVGKSLISQALGKVFALNFKTLLVELCEEESNDGFTCPAAIQEVSRNLFSVKIHPDQSLYEYLSLKFPNRRVLDTFLRQNLIRTLLFCHARFVRPNPIWKDLVSRR